MRKSGQRDASETQNRESKVVQLNMNRAELRKMRIGKAQFLFPLTALFVETEIGISND